MAPFALVAPLIGPLLDRQRGSRRAVVVGSLAGRALLCFLMARHLQGLLLFPEAFGALVLGKGYGVAKAALVPSVVDDPAELVQANAKLTLTSGVMGFVAAGPGLALHQLGGRWVLGLAGCIFVAGAVVALAIPAGAEAHPSSAAERAELRSAGVVLAAGAMAVLRAIVGFLAFLLAFAFRADDAPAWWFGLVIAASGVGTMLGAVAAPVVRRWVREERILAGSLLLAAAGGLLALRVGGRGSGVVLGLSVGAAASAGRLCFDAIVQRDAPDADKGRSFARFETQFQLVWVAAAMIPVALSVPTDAGYLVITVAAVVAAVSYLTGRQPWKLKP